MVHIGHKIKFKKGSDANQMMVHKLLANFLSTGSMRLTQKRAKVLRAQVDRLMGKALKEKVSKRELTKILRRKELVTRFTTDIVPSFKGQLYGFVKLSRLTDRIGDGAPMVRIEWTHPIAKIEIKQPEAKKPAVLKSKAKIKKEKVIEKKK